MSCIFHVGGVDFDIDACLRECRFDPCGVYRKGETHGKRGRIRAHSGFDIDVSQADWDDLNGQVADAIRFLKANRAELRKLMDFPGIEGRTLDFPIWQRDIMLQRDYLPPELLRLAGELEIGIVISRYGIAEDE